jgi:hypothetical protein
LNNFRINRQKVDKNVNGCYQPTLSTIFHTLACLQATPEDFLDVIPVPKKLIAISAENMYPTGPRYETPVKKISLNGIMIKKNIGPF